MTIQIAKYRKLAGYTQKEFAQLLNVKPNTYNQWETGKHQIDFESLIKIADILNITLDQIFDRNITKRNGTERNETKRRGIRARTDETIQSINSRRTSGCNRNDKRIASTR